MGILSKRISAFTLTEMLIVLVISAIVAGLAFTVISLFSKNIHIIEKNYNHNSQIRLLEQQMTIDFNRYHIISYNKDSEELKLKTPLDSAIYSFDETFILRNLDTVLKTLNSKKMYFSGDEISEGLVDAIDITLSKNKNDKSVFIYKENDASIFLNN